MRVHALVDHTEVPPGSVVTGIRAREGLCTLFDVDVEFLASDPDLDLDAMIWSTASVSMTPSRGGGDPRSFHGVVEEARYRGSNQHLHLYSLRLRPHLHGLRWRFRTRIFQELNAVDIIKQIFDDAGIPSDSVRWDTSAEYPVRTYCTQWKESELDFVLRLLEDEGIFYSFEHTEVDHTLCLADGPGVHQLIEPDPMLPLMPYPSDDAEGVWGVALSTRVIHDGMKTRDWSFESPAESLESKQGEGTERLRYEYPGGYTDNGDGGRLVGIRLEEQWRDRQVLRGSSNYVGLAEGKKIDLIGIQPDTLAGEYLLTALDHQVGTLVGDGIEDLGARGLLAYECALLAIPGETPYRPSRVTPRPVAHGLESAVVTGPGGEEIHVDEYGRIKVHFYWDRENPVDDTASCWVRFQQLNTHGAMILPRLGWEVHVAFENGDPDRPFAIHKAYNGESMPPYDQPANKTQSAMQSSTSPGGAGTNEIRLQDGNGGMEWFMHASKDLNVVVANDENETVGVDAVESVGNTMGCTVGADETGSIGGNQTLSVTADAQLETTANQSVTVGANDTWGTTASFKFDTSGDRTETIGGLMNVLANKIGLTVNGNFTRTVGAVQAIASVTAIGETVGGSKTETVAGAKAIITPAEVAENIGGTKTLNSGAITIKAGEDVQFAAKGAIAWTAAGVIEIKCTDDVQISGKQLRITSGKAKIKGGGGTFELGSNITIDPKKFGGKGGPMLKLKGTLNYVKK